MIILAKKDIKEHDRNLPELHDHIHKMLLVGESWYWKTNALLDLLDHESDIDKINLYVEDPYKARFQLFIDKRQITGLKYLNDSNAFTEYSNHMNDIFKNIEECNLNKKRKIFIVFDDMITDILSNKTLYSVVTKLFIITGRKANISLVFITQYFFHIPKNITFNALFCYENFKKREFWKFHLFIHEVFTFKILWVFIKNVLQNHIFS